MAIIKTITDLERIGDEAEKIGRMSSRLARNGTVSRKYLSGVMTMGAAVQSMVRESLDAFARLDVEEALRVVRSDEHVDEQYEATLRSLMTYMMEDPREISKVMDMIWCARALERIGDHAKNICEYIIFLVKGKDVRHTSFEQMEQRAHGVD